MSLEIHPSKDGFDNSKPQLVYARVINDLDTPVSAYLKIAKGKPYAFLFESVQGGEIRGRYSFLGFSPDVIWRADGDESEISRDGDGFKTLDGKPLDTLRALQQESAFDLPEGIPPMSAGLFGYLSYDMIRQVETLASDLPDPIGTPDAIMVRPTIVAVFDAVAQEIIVASPVYPGGSYDKAVKRIESVVRDLSLPVSSNVIEDIETPVIEPKLGTTLASFSDRVKKAKDYILSGDIFQVVIGQRLSAPLPASDFALYRSLRRMNPSPFLYFLPSRAHGHVAKRRRRTSSTKKTCSQIPKNAPNILCCSTLAVMMWVAFPKREPCASLNVSTSSAIATSCISFPMSKAIF